MTSRERATNVWRKIVRLEQKHIGFSLDNETAIRLIEKAIDTAIIEDFKVGGTDPD